MFRSTPERNRTRGGFVSEFFGFLEFAVDSGGGKPCFLGNLADGFLGGLEVDELLKIFGLGDFVFGAEVVCLAGVVFKYELEAAVHLADAVEDDVVGVVLILSGADFDLLDVAEIGVFGAAADGDACVEEVHQFGASGQVILRHWGAGLALRGMADYDQGEAVLLFEEEDLLHESAGGFAFFGVVEEEGDVVHEDVVDVKVLGSGCDAVEDGLLQVGVNDVFGAEFCPQ